MTLNAEWDIFSRHYISPMPESPIQTPSSISISVPEDYNFPKHASVTSPPSSVVSTPSPSALPKHPHNNTNSTPEPEVVRSSNTIYHIKRTASRRSQELRPGIYEFDLCESFTDYFCAVDAGYHFPLLGIDMPQPHHQHQDEQQQQQRPERQQQLTIHRQSDHNPTAWPYGHQCLIHAEAPNGDIFTIDIESESNKRGTLGDERGRVYWPLFFVVRADIRREEPTSPLTPAGQLHWEYESRIASSWASAKSARVAAYGLLLDEEGQGGGKRTKKDFRRYEDFDDQHRCRWGKNVVVHAVAEDGAHIFVALLKSWKVGGVDAGVAVK